MSHSFPILITAVGHLGGSDSPRSMEFLCIPRSHPQKASNDAGRDVVNKDQKKGYRSQQTALGHTTLHLGWL